MRLWISKERPWIARLPFAAACLLALAASSARSRADDSSSAPDSKQAASPPFGSLAYFQTTPTLLGDMAGLRPALGKYGVDFKLTDVSEAFGNVTGGSRLGADFDGQTSAALQLDTQRAFAWPGGTLTVSALDIHGPDISTGHLYVLQPVSGLNAPPGARFWEVWYQQKFGDNFSVRIGQQALDQEFITSQNAGYFLNASFGWPELGSANLPDGGPATPLSALGARASAKLGQDFTILAGVYSADPVGATYAQFEPGQLYVSTGGVYAIAELQYAPGSASAGDAGPATVYKIGAWFDSASFANLRYNGEGLPLGNPQNAETPDLSGGNYAAYAVADQRLWTAADPAKHLDAFVRPVFTSLQGQNLISISFNAGLTMHEPIAGRSGDVAGLAVAYARVSDGASGYDRDLANYNPGTFIPIRGAETVFETMYQAQVTPWWQLQPDLQYVINPGAGVENPNAPGQAVRNEFIIGLRSTVAF